MKVQVLGVGLLGPGLPDWAQGAGLLQQGWQTKPTEVPAPQRLPATERRRAGTVVKASIVVADQAVAAAGLAAAALPTVFTSSTGDTLNCHLLCEALAQAQRVVSPTRFTNSVHNAAAGYWHIALQSQAPSTSLAAFDASFAAGLLEAAVQCLAAQRPVLLVACDVPYPEPLHTLRPLPDVFAVALVLSPPQPTATGTLLQLELGADADADADAGSGAGADAGADADADADADSGAGADLLGCGQAGLEILRQRIPAARALPLLRALAGGCAARLVLPGAPGQNLLVHVAGR